MRRFHLRLSSLAWLASSLVATGAFAQTPSEPASAASGGPIVVEGQAGVAMPLGQFGLAADVDVGRGFALSAGVGMDDEGTVAPDVAPRYALMPRYRVAPLGGRATVSAGLGLSYGNRPPSGASTARADGELSLEYLFADGVRARAFGGFGRVLSPGADASAGERQSLFGGLALGYAVVPNPSVGPEASLSLRRWYGWQALALDALAGALYLGRDVGHAPPDPGLVAHRHTLDRAAAGVYLVSAPMVHVAHHHYVRAAVSLGLRLLAPLVATIISVRERGPEADSALVLHDVVVATVTGAVIDDLALAWEDHPFDPR